MTRLEIRPFSDEFLPHAGELLAARHRAHRAAEPLLPARYEDAVAAAAEVEALSHSKGPRVPSRFAARASSASCSASARVTRSGARTSGSSPPGTRSRRPRTCATCTARRQAGSRRAAPPLRARPGRRIDLVEAWSRVSFGQQHAYGIREVPEWPWPEGVRLAEERDIDALVELSPLIRTIRRWRRCSASGFRARPRRSARRRSSRTSRRGVGDLVAERDGRIVGVVPARPRRAVERHSASRARTAPRSSAGRRPVRTSAARAQVSR